MIDKYFQQDKFEQAFKHFEKAFFYSREHSIVAMQAYIRYGEKGPLISGVMQDHFPESVKKKLRRFCDLMNRSVDEGFKARPKGTRKATMRKLYQQVKSTYGTGWYL